MGLFRFVVVGALLLVNTLCLGAMSFDDIVPLIEKSASPEEGLTEAEWAAMERVCWLGPAVIPRLLPLLKHENAAVRELTTQTLCRMSNFTDEHLEALIESRRSGNEPITVAIAKVGTPRAFEFLVEELKKEKRTGTQIYWAFYILGEKGVPSLVRLIESEPLDDELVTVVVAIFGELKDKARSAVRPLTKFISASLGTPEATERPVMDLGEMEVKTEPTIGPLAESMSARQNKRAVKCAVLALGAIGERARDSMPVLEKLAQADPGSYRDVVDRSLQAMTTPETIADVLRRLGDCPDASAAQRDLDRWKLHDESSLDALIEFIKDRKGSENGVGWAVWLIGAIGPKAQRAVPVLLRLAEENPNLYQNMVDRALLQIGDLEATPGVLRLLEGRLDGFGIRDIAKLREAGRPAGPALVRLLAQDDWELRLDAARTIGYIGYTEGVPHLLELLHDKDDWRQAFVAAQSLGRLRAAEAVGPLTEIAIHHWYPPVQEAARKAICVIAGQATYEEPRETRFSFLSEFEDYMRLNVPDVLASVDTRRQNPAHAVVIQEESLDKGQLAGLAYEEELFSSHMDETSRIVEKRATVKRVPEVGIQVDDGYLVGWDQGEFGGGLLFIDRTGKRTSLWENTQGVYRTTCGIVAVTGYGHFTTRGMLVRVFRGEDGTWQARRWKTLPGVPRSSCMLANGSIRIACSNGHVDVLPSGDIQMAGFGE